MGIAELVLSPTEGLHPSYGKSVGRRVGGGALRRYPPKRCDGGEYVGVARAKPPSSETFSYYLCVFARDIPNFGWGLPLWVLRGEYSRL